MNKIFLSVLPIFFLGFLAVTPARAQTNFTLNQLQLQVRQTANVVALLPGQWTHGDWDDSHVVDEFVSKLEQLSQRLEGLEGLIEQFNPDSLPSTKAKILAWLRVSAGQVKGLESMAQQHLITPEAREGVFSDLEEIENLLDESVNLMISDH